MIALLIPALLVSILVFAVLIARWSANNDQDI